MVKIISGILIILGTAIKAIDELTDKK